MQIYGWKYCVFQYFLCEFAGIAKLDDHCLSVVLAAMKPLCFHPSTSKSHAARLRARNIVNAFCSNGLVFCNA